MDTGTQAEIGTRRFTPNMVQPVAVERARAVPIDAGARWFCVVYGEWGWDSLANGGDGAWMPVLNEAKIRAGANGTGIRPDGSLHYAALFVGILGKKGTIIQPHDPRLGQRFGGYLGEIVVSGGPRKRAGKRYIYRWTRVVLSRNGRTARVVLDQDMHDAFRRHLVQVGIVAPMDPEMLEEHLTRLNSRRREFGRLLAKGNMSADDVRAAEARVKIEVDALKAGWEALEADGLTDGTFGASFNDAPAAAIPIEREVIEPTTAPDMEVPTTPDEGQLKPRRLSPHPSENPWGRADVMAERMAVVRGVETLEDLEALALSNPPGRAIQAQVVTAIETRVASFKAGEG